MASSAPDPRPSSVGDRQKLVAEYEQTVRSEEERTRTQSRASLHQKRTIQVGTLGILLAVISYLWLAPPDWLKPRPIPIPPPAVREAGMRFSIYLQAQRIEHFRTLKGRLPTTLAEAGEPIDGIGYTVLNGTTYSLEAVKDTSLHYLSTDSPTAFVGGSMELLGNPQ